MLLYNPTVSGSLLVTGSLTTTGTLTAQTLVVQTITSSVDFVTGSSVNGSLSSNTHQFTGSVLMTGSLDIIGGEFKVGRVDSSNEGGQISFGRASDNATAWYIDAYSNAASPQLRFVDAIATTVRMTLTGSNVGIGTSSPLSLLHINGLSGTAGLPSFLLYGESGATGQRYGLNVSTDQLDVSALGTNARIAFFTGGNASSITERMRINSDGTIRYTLANENANITHNGAFQIANGGTKTITVTNGSLIFISENNTGDGALFHANYASSTVTLISNPGGRYANTDTASKICLFKNSSSGTATLKNNTGSQFSFTTFTISNTD